MEMELNCLILLWTVLLKCSARRSRLTKTVVIQVKSGIVNKTDSGVVADVVTSGKTIKLVNAAGATEQYTYTDNLIILYQNRILSLADLKAGSNVKYTVKDSVLQTIELAQGVEQSVRGTLVEIGGNQSTLTFKRDGGSLEAKLLSEKPEVIINGIQDATLNDLITDASNGDKVELTLNSDDQVTRIQVIGRQMEPLNGVTVVSYNSKTKVLTVLDANKSHMYLHWMKKRKWTITQPNRHCQDWSPC